MSKQAWIALVLGGLMAVGSVACGHGIYSGSGKKIGQVLQLGSHGMVCATYEGKLARGGLNGGSGAVGGVFEFTVEGDELFKALIEAMEKQEEIEVTYEKVTFSGPCTSESDHFVKSFRVLQQTLPSEADRQQAIDKLKKELETLEHHQ